MAARHETSDNLDGCEQKLNEFKEVAQKQVKALRDEAAQTARQVAGVKKKIGAAATECAARVARALKDSELAMDVVQRELKDCRQEARVEVECVRGAMEVLREELEVAQRESEEHVVTVKSTWQKIAMELETVKIAEAELRSELNAANRSEAAVRDALEAAQKQGLALAEDLSEAEDREARWKEDLDEAAKRAMMQTIQMEEGTQRHEKVGEELEAALEQIRMQSDELEEASARVHMLRNELEASVSREAAARQDAQDAPDAWEDKVQEVMEAAEKRGMAIKEAEVKTAREKAMAASRQVAEAGRVCAAQVERVLVDGQQELALAKTMQDAEADGQQAFAREFDTLRKAHKTAHHDLDGAHAVAESLRQDLSLAVERETRLKDDVEAATRHTAMQTSQMEVDAQRHEMVREELKLALEQLSMKGKELEADAKSHENVRQELRDTEHQRGLLVGALEASEQHATKLMEELTESIQQGAALDQQCDALNEQLDVALLREEMLGKEMEETISLCERRVVQLVSCASTRSAPLRDSLEPWGDSPTSVHVNVLMGGGPTSSPDLEQLDAAKVHVNVLMGGTLTSPEQPSRSVTTYSPSWNLSSAELQERLEAAERGGEALRREVEAAVAMCERSVRAVIEAAAHNRASQLKMVLHETSEQRWVATQAARRESRLKEEWERAIAEAAFLREELCSLQRQHELQKEELETALQQQGKLMERGEMHTAQTEEQRKCVSALEMSCEALTISEKGLIEELGIVRRDITATKAELDSAKGEVASVKAELLSARCDLGGRTNELEAARKEKEGVREELWAARRTEAGLREQLEAAKRGEGQLRLEWGTVKNSKEELKMELNAIKNEAHILQQSLDEVRRAEERLKAQCLGQNQDLETARQDATALKREMYEMSQGKDTLQVQLARTSTQTLTLALVRTLAAMLAPAPSRPLHVGTMQT